MGSRDFGFLSLRPPLVAYQANGLPVPPNNVLTTSNTGAASFTSAITISTINVNTINSNNISSNIIDANTISATFIDVSVLSTTTHYTSTISTTTLDTGYLQAGEARINGPFKVEGNSEFIPTTPSTLGGFKIQLNSTNLTTDAAGSNLFVYRYPGTTNTYLSNDGGGSITLGTTNAYISTLQINPNGNVNVNGDLTVSDGISTNNISTINIIAKDISVISSINLLNTNASTLELSWNTSTLYVGGFPVATDGTVSTVSTVFWNPDISGGIYNKNIGVSPLYYQVGVGNNGAPLNATLDVKYGGGANYGNVFNVSTSNGQRLTFDSNGVLSTNIINMTNGQITGLNTITSQTTLDINGIVNINDSVFMNSTVHISSTGGNGALKIQSNSGNTYIESGNNFTGGSANKLYFTSINAISTAMVIDTNNRLVGINTATPKDTLDVNGSIILTSSNVTISRFTTQGGDSFIESDNALRFTNIGAFSTTMIVLPNPTPRVGINTQSPQATLDVAGNIIASTGFNTGNTQYLAGPTINAIGYNNNSTVLTYYYDNSNDRDTLAIAPPGNSPSEIIFKTATSSSNVSTEALRITNSGNVNISSGLTLNGTVPGEYGALKIQGGTVENDIFIYDGTTTNSPANSGYFIGVTTNFAGNASTFQIGRIDSGTAQTNKAIYLTQSGSVGINTNNPQATLDINGNTYIQGYLGINTNPASYQFDLLGNAQISGTLFLPNTLASANISTTNLTTTNSTIFKNFVTVESDLQNGNTGGLRIIPVTAGNASGITISNSSGTSQWSLQNNNNNFIIYNYSGGTPSPDGYSIELTTNQLNIYRNTTINNNLSVTGKILNNTLLNSTTITISNTYILSSLINNPVVIGYVRVVILAVGGGGGGGGTQQNEFNCGAGGGGSGQEVNATYYLPVTESLHIQIGIGGGGDTSGSPGQLGGATTISSTNINIYAVGGAGGVEPGGNNQGGAGGNGWYGGGAGRSGINNGGSSSVAYGMRSGGIGGGGGNPGDSPSGILSNASISQSGSGGGGGQSSFPGSIGGRGGDSTNNGVGGNGLYGGGGGGNGNTAAIGSVSGKGGDGAVYIQIFSI